jgi:hypothetical protein
VSGLIDSTLDELDRQVRELKRELTMIEAFRRQLSPLHDDSPTPRPATSPSRHASVIPPANAARARVNERESRARERGQRLACRSGLVSRAKVGLDGGGGPAPE